MGALYIIFSLLGLTIAVSSESFREAPRSFKIAIMPLVLLGLLCDFFIGGMLGGI